MLCQVCLSRRQKWCSKQHLELERNSVTIIQLLQSVYARSLRRERGLTLGFLATVRQLWSRKAIGQTYEKSLIVIKSSMPFSRNPAWEFFLFGKPNDSSLYWPVIIAYKGTFCSSRNSRWAGWWLCSCALANSVSLCCSQELSSHASNSQTLAISSAPALHCTRTDFSGDVLSGYPQ